MTDELGPEVARVLTSYLHAAYEAELSTLPADAPIWMSFSNNNYRGAISTQTIANICEKHLKESRSHVLRHTFAIAMDDAGASLSEIGDRLGHNNLKTTSDYMKRQRASKNRYASKLVTMFGIE